MGVLFLYIRSTLLRNPRGSRRQVFYFSCMILLLYGVVVIIYFFVRENFVMRVWIVCTQTVNRIPLRL
jgi:hypothetical protein